MTSSSATFNRRRAASHRTAVRRRRAAAAAVLVGLLLVGLVLAMPLARKAVNALTLPLAHEDIIRQQASEKHVDAALIAAVIFAETKFDPRTSSAGAEGLMQILPETAVDLAHRSGATSFHVSDLGTPQVNIAYGTYYLHYLLDEYGNQKLPAIAAYNAGEANVSRWIAQARAAHHRFSRADIPFPETRAYVAKVLRAQHDYRSTYPAQLGYL